MVAQMAMPTPMRQMLGYLNINIERGFETMPEKMEDGMLTCMTCEMFHTCDYDVESRYFVCPNRDLFDRLEDLQEARYGQEASYGSV